MYNWDKFKENAKGVANKTAAKTRELTDAAALKLKIANKEADRDVEYKRLGKLSYVKLKQLEGHDSAELTESISTCLDRLDKIHMEIAELKSEENAKKAEKNAEKNAEKAAKKAKKQAEKEESEKLNMRVMEEFAEAREVADEEYQKAKQAAEDAKEQQ